MKTEVLHLGTTENSNIRKEVRTTSSEATQMENRGEDRQENRQFRNRNLQDLIRILLIRELLRRRRRRRRPPFRPPMRPPFPGGGGRPPFNRGFEPGMSQMQFSDYDIYERY